MLAGFKVLQTVTNHPNSAELLQAVSNRYGWLPVVELNILSKNSVLSPYMYRPLTGDTMNYAQRFQNSTTQVLFDLRSLREVRPRTSSGHVCLGLSGHQGLLEREPRTGRTA